MQQDITGRADRTPQSEPQNKTVDIASSMGFLSEWNAEIMRFYLHRYQQYWALPMRLQSCRSPDDWHSLQMDFLRKLLEDYQGEASKLSKIAGADGGQTDADLQSAYAASLLKAQGDAAAIIEQAKDQAERIVASAHDRAGEPAEAPKAARTRKRA